MILKEKEIRGSQDPKIRAGEEAEKQMAFYLKRAFANKEDIFVLNDLRITYENEVAQIDHLIITNYGIFIIESKSVHGEILVNQNDEWSRTYNNRKEGIASPVLQAEAQGRLLKNLLINNKEKLRSKFLGIQQGFNFCPILVYIAVSDSGIIGRNTAVPELFKADQITQTITKKHDQLKKKNSLFSLSTDIWKMTPDEAKDVAEFLLSQHQPLQKSHQVTQEKITSQSNAASVQTTTQEQLDKTFVPKIGATCPSCKTHKLIRKSIKRIDNTETDFLACAAYPADCKTIFALVAVAKKAEKQIGAQAPDNAAIKEKASPKEGDDCPKCKSGKLIRRKAKTEFLGCTAYPKCKFTDYRYLENHNT